MNCSASIAAETEFSARPAGTGPQVFNIAQRMRQCGTARTSLTMLMGSRRAMTKLAIPGGGPAVGSQRNCSNINSGDSSTPRQHFSHPHRQGEQNAVKIKLLHSGSEVLHHADAGPKPGGKAEASALQRFADFQPNGAEFMTRNTSIRI
jgi:hypothetical protein